MDISLLHQAKQPIEQPIENQQYKDFRVFKVGKYINDWKRDFIEKIKSEFYETKKEFVLNDSNKKQIAFCFDWAAGNNIDRSLNKGLFLTGAVGTGKSCILKATMNLVTDMYFRDLIYKPMYETADRIARIYEGKIGDDTSLNKLYHAKLLFIDDIGYESIKVFETCPIGDLVRERYDKKRITCFTSNLDMPGVQARYKESLEDKINQMCFIVSFKGESKR